MAAINANLAATASSSHEIADQPLGGDGAASLSHEIATGSESIDGGGGNQVLGSACCHPETGARQVFCDSHQEVLGNRVSAVFLPRTVGRRM